MGAVLFGNPDRRWDTALHAHEGVPSSTLARTGLLRSWGVTPVPELLKNSSDLEMELNLQYELPGRLT